MLKWIGSLLICAMLIGGFVLTHRLNKKLNNTENKTAPLKDMLIVAGYDMVLVVVLLYAFFGGIL